MNLAYVNRGNNKAHKEALKCLTKELSVDGITVVASFLPYESLPELQTEPFLYYASPLVRMGFSEKAALDLHKKSPCRYIKSSNNKVVSINLAQPDDQSNTFVIDGNVYSLPESIFDTKPIIKKRSRALMTSIGDGTPYLDIWLNYYRRYFDNQDIYFICHQSPEHILESLDGNKIIHDISVYNMVEKRILLNRIQEELLHTYETVVYADLDEIIYHPDGLDTVINTTTSKVTRCQGYNILHLRDLEKPLDVNQPISEQRAYWARSWMYDKPIIMKEPFLWTPGLHEIAVRRGINWRSIAVSYADLLLLHLRNTDYDIAYQLNAKNVKNKVKLFGGGHHCLFLDDKFNAWWDSFTQNASLIPEDIRQGFNF